MKSLLVDAMRQANKSDNEAALSDSGSFDTTTDQFAETANDSVVDAPQTLAGDLQLLDADTPEGDVVDAELPVTDSEATPPTLPVLEASGAEGSKELSPEWAVPETAAPALSKAPGLSRFSPAICIAAFVAAGLAWSGWQTFQAWVAGSHLGVSPVAGAPLQSAAGESGANVNVERFPFIAGTETVAASEADE